jgi:hypothetical protein
MNMQMTHIFSHQAAVFFHAFTHALVNMGLGFEGASTYEDDEFF